jgi:hypothetical protein
MYPGLTPPFLTIVGSGYCRTDKKKVTRLRYPEGSLRGIYIAVMSADQVTRCNSRHEPSPEGLIQAVSLLLLKSINPSIRKMMLYPNEVHSTWLSCDFTLGELLKIWKL